MPAHSWFRRRYWPLFAALGLMIGAVACEDPTSIRPPPVRDQDLVLFMVIDPDSTAQQIIVEAVDPNGWWEGFVRAEVFDEKGALLAAQTQDRVPFHSDRDQAPLWMDLISPCIRRYGGDAFSGPATCFTLAFQPEPGKEYRLRVSAEGRPPVEARAIVPGPFELTYVNALGFPPGTSGLEVRWTPSAGAYRYIVALRSREVTCYSVHGCHDGWFVVTDSTELSTRVPAAKLREGHGPWHISVYAVDKALYEYLTTGSGGNYFSVPPISNVEGGYGVVGSWRERRHTFLY